jgi:hypothetical protein
VIVGGGLQAEPALADTTDILGAPDRTYNPCASERKRSQDQRITCIQL